MSFDPPLPPFNSGDPNASFLSASCLDLLLIELVPFAYRLSSATRSIQSSSAPASDGAATDGAGGVSNSAGAPAATGFVGAASGAKMAQTLAASTDTLKASGFPIDEGEREAVFYRLENLGYRVGIGLVEKFSRDRPRFTDTLDVIKFLCKDLWILCWMKHVDNLKTNHRGVYVLTDNTFRPLARMSAEAGTNPISRATTFLWYPCGILRGALAAMGVNATVTADTSGPPIAVFQITTSSQAAPKF